MLILGIDQGSTQTRAAICDGRGKILGFGKSFGACHSVTGMGSAMRAAAEASQAAIETAGVSNAEVDILFAGLTGADWPEDYSLLEDNLMRLGLAKNVRVVNDSLVALRGGTQAAYGGIVIAGTAANCAILSPAGQEFIYHYYIEDHLQGGVGLGRSVLQAIFRSATGRERETMLTPSVLKALGFSSVEALLRARIAGRLSHDRVKDLAPLFLQIAYEGDAVAREIVTAFAFGLAELVTAGFERFSMTHLEVEVVISGSIFKSPCRLLADVMAAEIQKPVPGARLINAR